MQPLASSIATLPRPIRSLILGIWPQQSITIGTNCLKLDTSQRHERRYFEQFSRGQKTIDTLIAERFVRPGDVVLDAGANIGFVSLTYLALGASRVHAVEPVSTLYERLSQVRDPRLSVYQVCLSDHNGDGYIFCSVGHNQGHTLNAQFLDLFPDAFGISPPRQPVHLFRADDLFPETRFDFMKIDVEGSEAALLDGAKRLLSKSAPRAIQIEIYPSQFEQVDARLRPYFSSARRAAVIGEALVLSDIDSPPPKGPPIFVYSNEAGL